MNRRSEIEPERQTLRARIRETTVQAILAAAEEVFADAGFHAARMGAIAAKAGVSVGTLYNHFEDREALLGGLLAAQREELIARIDQAIGGGAGRPLRDRLRGIVGAFLAHCEQHRKFVHLALQRELGRYQQTYPQAWAKKTDTMQAIYERVEGEMKRGLKERALRPEIADLAATFFIGMLRALIIRDLVLGKGDGMAAEIDGLLDMFFDGAGAGGGARRRGTA
jgi:AcrR family transcriptional regulator